ncbi:MAG TPA: hypothetical protein PLO37_04225 [Candidatus Hydrogenedentes bacterium]|nr:hypothetical protein [Candidatus Hydrogenedentota bacterium]HPG66031.1 hypothetical protein [Candidatus Hydrogenedentota bacterium]
MSKRTRYDLNAPGTQALRDRIVHGAYTTEGTMVAFPLCFPGMTIPIAADESRITALDLAHDGVIYGGTSGRCAHVFFAMFHGATGLAFDMDAVEDANHCAAVCCGATHMIACVNGPSGGRIVRRGLQGLPFDLLQEWGFSRPPFDDLGPAVAGERIVHAVADGSGDGAVVATERHVVALAIGTGTLRVVGETPGMGRIARASDGGIVGVDAERGLWRYRPQDGPFERTVAPFPEGDWRGDLMRWARDPVTGTLYTADTAGRLFAFREDTGFSSCLGQTPLAPVGPMAVAFDGRLFGACGDGIAKTFCYDPGTGEVTSLGVAVSILERRRYGYVFGDAITGRDGQIIFGEDDDLGHLWMYFPRLLRRRA